MHVEGYCMCRVVRSWRIDEKVFIISKRTNEGRRIGARGGRTVQLYLVVHIDCIGWLDGTNALSGKGG